MPATSAITYAELKKRVASRAMLIQQNATTGKVESLASEPAATRIEEAIADGVREFFRAHSWSWLIQSTTLTLNPDGTGPLNLDSDPARYLLPDFVESLPKGKVLFRSPDASWGGQVKMRHIDDVANRLYRDPSASGQPVCAAAEYNSSLAPGISTNGRFEFIVCPKPDLAYPLRLRVKLGPVPFVADHQVGQWPSVHDLTVVAFCVRELFEHDRDPEDQMQARAYVAADAKVASTLATSIERDDEDFRPQELGSSLEDDQWPIGRVLELTDVPSGDILAQKTVYS